MNGPDKRAAELSPAELERYEWQCWVPDFGEAGQRKLKNASVLVTRCGGLGGVVAYQLAAAGIGRLVLAHAGNVRPSDLNRQLLMTTAGIGRPRIESAVRRLRELNPHVELVGVAENVSTDNAARLVADVDLVVDCAPLFTERFLLNEQVVRQRRTMVECAVYELDAQITTIVPGESPCLTCLYPEPPPHWRRQFPVFGAVSGTVGAMAAMEAIKVIAGFGQPLVGRLLTFDLRDMTTFTARIERDPRCATCGQL
jgi:molybdopterin-synthase adenylyltransferase